MKRREKFYIVECSNGYYQSPGLKKSVFTPFIDEALRFVTQDLEQAKKVASKLQEANPLLTNNAVNFKVLLVVKEFVVYDEIDIS